MADPGIVQTGGFEMEYFKFGRGNKTFVTLPGLSIQSVMRSKDAVEEAYRLLSDDFTSYVFDRRKEIPDNYSIYDMADDTVAVMKELGLRDIYIFGASQGGMIALTIAARYPGLVKKLVLGSTSSHVLPSQQAVVDKWIELAKNKNRLELYLEYGKEIYPPDVYEEYKDFFAEASTAVTDEELERFVILAQSIKRFDITDELDRIDCPVLALGSFDDPVLDSDATMVIAENLDYRPDFSLYMYNGYGHASFDTAPGYKQKVLDFLLK